MKKLLVLALVFGLASMANAALSVVPGPTMSDGQVIWSVDVTGTQLIGTSASGTAAKYIGAVGLTGDDAAETPIFTNAQTYVAVGVGSITWNALYNAYDVDSQSLGMTTNGPGQWYSIDLDLTGQPNPGQLSLYCEQYNANYDVIGSGDMVLDIVPEPITMTLMGLGGLGLLRRRR